MVIAHAHSESVGASLQTPKAERRVLRVLAPQTIILDGELLNIKWQIMEELQRYSSGGKS